MSKPVVEALFGSGAKSKVMSFLYLRAQGSGALAARALAREAEVPYGSISKTLRELTDDQLVVREETSTGPQYRAPFEDSRLVGLFLLLRQDSLIVQQIRRAMRSFKSIDYAGIYGSFASGRTHRESDVDVLILEQPGLDRLAVMSAVARVSERVKRQVHPAFYSADEFAGKLDALDPVSLSILANPRIDLKGSMPLQK